MESWRGNGTPEDLTPLVADKSMDRKQTRTAHEDGLDGERTAREAVASHHLMPFAGTCSLGYIPAGQVIGLSKLARLVSCFAHRLQIQEQLTTEIADALWEHLRPRGVGVVIAARHCCMGCRGVRKPSAQLVTRALRGELRDDPQARAEFLSFCERGSGRRRDPTREKHDGDGLH